MSIAPMRRIAVIAAASGRDLVLRRLQELGVLHLEPGAAIAAPQAAPSAPDLTAPLEAADPDRAADASDNEDRRALAFLLASPWRRRAALADDAFDAEAVRQRALAVEARMKAVDEEMRALLRRERVLSPLGDFRLDPALLDRGLRLWFYAVPASRLAGLPATLPVWHEVARDHRFRYVAVVAAEEPQQMPVARLHTGSLSLGELQARRRALEVEADELQAERAELSRWREALARHIAGRADAVARLRASGLARNHPHLVEWDAWVPAAALPALRHAVLELPCAVVERPARDTDTPPTLLVNDGAAGLGEMLLRIYATPHARGWDPSAWIFAAFVLFFGMVMSDLGYALILLVGLPLWRPRTASARAARRLFAWLGLSAALWGLATGTWFGGAPPALLAWPAWLDGTDLHAMMALALGMGAFHLTLASLAAAHAARGAARWAALGWASVVAGGAAAGAAQAATGRFAAIWAVPATCGFAVALIARLAGVSGWGQRLAAVAQSLVRLPAALGDVLSYLRLFALAYAGSSLAGASNALAAQVASVPGFGVLLAAAVLVIGHALNLVLSVLGGFVHGLRLNFIEFFSWAGIEEGRPFVPFKREEDPPWRPPSSSSPE